MKRATISLLVGLCISTVFAQNDKVTSILEVYDITTGERHIVKEFAGTRIEAPNWTVDGNWLIYNSHGLLYRISPDNPTEPQLIDTDYARQCNNDHVLSADGKHIAISHGTKEDWKSRIYTLPIDGGVPQLITPLGPSYLHGWSPDGKWLTYCADRNGNYDVYIIPAHGGEEIRLTTSKGLDDGPEYSPCGKYIWFNSVRTGTMQVWRMNADGGEQTQMTFDENKYAWFPHISPDGQNIVYLTYNKGDLLPSQHLPDKHVELQLMSSSGGTPKTIVKLFGGQGTINVNSWSPDSKRFAFVSYRSAKK